MSWVAAKTKFKGEFKALDFFKSIGINSYVPSYKTKRVWSDRIKKVTVPAISGYIFFELSKINYDMVNINPFTKNIVKGLNGLPAVISEKEINGIIEEAKIKDYQIIMTEKDYFKVKDFNLQNINYLKVSLEIDGLDKLISRINQI